MSTCAQCGATVEGAFCGECGARYVPPAREPAPTPPPAPVAPPITLRRPEASPFMVRVAVAIPAGSTVIVDAGDRFVGERFGAGADAHGPGSHAIEEDLEAGWFVREALELAFEEDLGFFEDVRASKARVAAKGTARFRVDEPADYVASALAAIAEGGTPPDAPSVAAKLREKLGELIGEQVRTLLAKGRYFTTLHSTLAVDEIRNEVRETYAGDAERDPATSIEIVKLQLGSETVPEGASDEDRAPKTISRPLAWLPGAKVRVAWTDGRRYPGVVRTTACLVAFEDGQEQWIPLDAIAEAPADEEPPSSSGW
jgi:hypothetical protein